MESDTSEDGNSKRKTNRDDEGDIGSNHRNTKSTGFQ